MACVPCSTSHILPHPQIHPCLPVSPNPKPQNTHIHPHTHTQPHSRTSSRLSRAALSATPSKAPTSSPPQPQSNTSRVSRGRCSSGLPPQPPPPLPPLAPPPPPRPSPPPAPAVRRMERRLRRSAARVCGWKQRRVRTRPCMPSSWCVGGRKWGRWGEVGGGRRWGGGRWSGGRWEVVSGSGGRVGVVGVATCPGYVGRLRQAVQRHQVARGVHTGARVRAAGRLRRLASVRRPQHPAARGPPGPPSPSQPTRPFNTTQHNTAQHRTAIKHRPSAPPPPHLARLRGQPQRREGGEGCQHLTATLREATASRRQQAAAGQQQQQQQQQGCEVT